jgi:ribonuclease/clavin/mitogillin
MESERPPDTPHTIQDVSTIIVSHRHHDHIDGLPSVLALLRHLWEARGTSAPFTPPRIYKFPLSAANRDPHVEEVISNLAPESFTSSPSGSPMHDLVDDQIFPLEGEATLQIMHTPGHTSDSVCMLLRESGTDSAIFTADTILGGSTSVFEDLSTYMKSLTRIQSVITKSGVQPFKLYPGHGPEVTDGAGTVNIYITHRMQRETAIRKLLEKKSPNGGEAWTPTDIVKVLYREVPQDLWKMATKGVILHLKKLEDEGVVDNLGGDGPGSLWELSQ